VMESHGRASGGAVGSDSTVRYRRIEPGGTYGDMWCIDRGLQAGEAVVANGVQKMRDGAKVIPEIR